MKKTIITKTIFFITILALIKIATFAQKAELVVQTGHTSWVNSVAFSPNAKILASGSADKTVKLWDAVLGQELKTLSGHISYVQSVAFSPTEKLLLRQVWTKQLSCGISLPETKFELL